MKEILRSCYIASKSDEELQELKDLRTNDLYVGLESGCGEVVQAISKGSKRSCGRKSGAGTGFLIEGTAAFITSGPQFEAVKKRFPWARAALEITVVSVTQTL